MVPSMVSLKSKDAGPSSGTRQDNNLKAKAK
jgi:hypothetical protein